eukprot:6998022-Prymnesium_polylepis.1
MRVLLALLLSYLQYGLSSTAQTLSVSLALLAAVSAASSHFRFFWLHVRGSAYIVGMPSTDTAKPASWHF